MSIYTLYANAPIYADTILAIICRINTNNNKC